MKDISLEKTAHIVNAINKYRDDNGLSKTDLSRMLGIPRYTMSRWEKGLSRISPAMMKLLKNERVI